MTTLTPYLRQIPSEPFPNPSTVAVLQALSGLRPPAMLQPIVVRVEWPPEPPPWVAPANRPAGTSTPPLTAAPAASPRNLTIKEVSTRLRIGKSKLQELLADPDAQLPRLRLGTRVVVPSDQLDAWVAKRASKDTPTAIGGTPYVKKKRR